MSDIKKRSVPISHILAAFFFPPLGVFLTVGLGAHFWINLVLTLFFTWIPGVIHAFWLLFNHNALVNKNEAKTSSLPNPNEIKYPTIDESQLNDDLSSAVGIDYRNLRNFLAVKDFKSANKETESIFKECFFIDIGRVSVDPERPKSIPCTDICTIDRLWVKYSKGYFGISVQDGIWSDIFLSMYLKEKDFANREKLEKTDEQLRQVALFESWRKFNNKLGWKSDIKYIYDFSAPKGHLPVLYHPHSNSCYCAMTVLFDRLRKCLE
ncbi:YqaE/Pmp3 family membrane protein [Planktothrix paucivesiculata]|uniref:GUN4 domain protein (Modular protein) n=1 Tax=Planktothrix paucivesiculata PCC 9631 TaxID=671071 RepID=A0A7Z9BGA0_9CYAN|nr:YqaE/Pmp3 family membrane protein [Planktothrix paucivesiculata]VXD12684.1 GUN4 domain protein (modular protein) [Planktothrix paucivesiculata PCC 9631]